ncbi:5-methylcytosine restriction system specificity protein McrC [Sorangium sp. So ce128]|uniref:5-methylcytosine restriction system specificity protein McrC n=1 Tax=Sorangium sp. So ce128 TaxID=3133281 RepID=UPI003F640CD3
MSDVDAKDCSPILWPSPDPETAAWLARLAQVVVPEAHVIGFGDGAREHDDPVVYCECDGSWWCGRYVGAIRFEGRMLRIRPRFGMAVLEQWIEHALNLTFTEVSGELDDHDAFLPQLLARLWSRALVTAGRHGLPALRQDTMHHGPMLRGRLDVQRTVRERVAGRPGLSSVQRSRSLENAVVQAIVAGYAALRRWVGNAQLGKVIAERAQDLVDHMLSAMPLTAGPPLQGEIDRVRYTPITAGYHTAVRLSMRIARHRGLFHETTPDGGATGVLLDVAEIWELFVIACLRAAHPEFDVLHGTHDVEANDWLLTSESGNKTLGWLKPDALLRLPDGVLIVDAKYKSLRPRGARPHGVEREDLYQVGAYLSRFANDGGEALLVYPADGDASPPEVVAEGPWRFGSGQRLGFVALPTDAETAVDLLRRRACGGG